MPHREPQSPDGANVGTHIILSFELYILPLRNKSFYPKRKKLREFPFNFKSNPLVVI
jgi:hypothetical protein